MIETIVCTLDISNGALMNKAIATPFQKWLN